MLSRPEHFKKYVGHDVNVKLFTPLDGKKAFSGTLVSYEDGVVTVAVGKKEISFDASKAAQIRLDIKF